MKSPADNSLMTEPTSPNLNTRRWERFKVELRIKARYEKNGQEIKLFGQGQDVSEGGMAAYLPAEIAPGEVIELEMTPPYSTRSIFARATVRNREGYRYGLEYLHIAPADRELLVRSIKALALVQ
jgi:c-di-GMP-binding flagellar brake protein YcgR